MPDRYQVQCALAPPGETLGPISTGTCRNSGRLKIAAGCDAGTQLSAYPRWASLGSLYGPGSVVDAAGATSLAGRDWLGTPVAGGDAGGAAVDVDVPGVVIRKDGWWREDRYSGAAMVCPPGTVLHDINIVSDSAHDEALLHLHCSRLVPASTDVGLDEAAGKFYSWGAATSAGRVGVDLGDLPARECRDRCAADPQCRMWEKCPAANAGCDGCYNFQGGFDRGPAPKPSEGWGTGYFAGVVR